MIESAVDVHLAHPGALHHRVERFLRLDHAIRSMIGVKEENDIDSLFTPGTTTALVESIRGLSPTATPPSPPPSSAASSITAAPSSSKAPATA